MKTTSLSAGLLEKKPNGASQKESVANTAALPPELLHKMNAYWRAANYLSVGQIYLYDNPLLKEALKQIGRAHV